MTPSTDSPVSSRTRGGFQSEGPYAATVDPKEVLRVLRRRKRVILGLVVLVTAVVGVVAHNLTPHYTATTSVMMDTRDSHVVDLEAVMEGLPQDAATLETQAKFIRSPAHAEKVVEQLGLATNERFNPLLREDRSFSALVLPPLEWAASWIPPNWLIASGRAGEENEPEAVPDSMLHEEAVGALLADLEVAQDGGSSILQITYTATDPEIAATVANGVARIYVEGLFEARRSATRKATAWLGNRLEELREQLRQSEQAIKTFRADHNLTDRGLTLGDQQLADLNGQLILTRAERAGKEAKLRTLRTLRQGGEGYESVSEVLGSPLIQSMRQQEGQLAHLEAQLSQEYGERHPRILQLQAEQADLTRRIDTEVQNILRNLENELAVVQAREQAIEDSIGSARHASTISSQAEVQLQELEREAEASRALYAAFLNRFKETGEQGDLLEPEAQVISPAAVPESPSFPRPKLMTAAGFTASLFLGVLLAFLVELLDSALRSCQQVERSLGVGGLGLVPRVKGQRSKLHRYMLQNPASAYAEAVRGLHTVLQGSGGPNRAPKVVLVTSALPGEGKTTLALSLAAAAARAGRRTLVVDLDFRHPSTIRELSGPIHGGLDDHLLSGAELKAVIHIDQMQRRLHVLPVRQRASAPDDLLASPQLRQLLAVLRTTYDCVILDSPPLLGLADTRMLVPLADTVLLAVQWGKTTVDVARNGLRVLREADADLAGIVLTQVDLKRHAAYAYGDVGQYYHKYKHYYAD